MATLHQALDLVEFARIRFLYTRPRPADATPRPLPTLRPLLHRSGQERLDPDLFDRLFTPAPASDPSARRRHQLPAPPFALQPAGFAPPAPPGSFALDLHLFGDGIALLDPLAVVMAGLAEEGGLFHRAAVDLHTIAAVDAAGTTTPLWQRGAPLVCAPPPRLLPRWLCDTPPAAPPVLQLLTPARLVSRGTPLFAPTIRKILPFVARRVTAMLHTWCAVEINDIPELLATAEGLQAETALQWEDWRRGGQGEDLGGVVGSIRLTADVPEEILLLLRLGALMNIGKGASYGAGAYRVEAA